MPDRPEGVFVYGAGGHGRAVAEVIRRDGRYRIACVLDDEEQPSGVLGSTWIGGREQLPSLRRDGIRRGLIAIGDNDDRARLTALLADAGLETVTLVDPSAVVAGDAVVGSGTTLMPLSFIGANASVGRGAIVNTSATVDHDCVVGAFAQLGPGVHLTGGCLVGDFAFIGIGAVLGKPVSIGERTIVGAGAVVLSDLPPDVVAAGVPARILGPVARDPLTDVLRDA